MKYQHKLVLFILLLVLCITVVIGYTYVRYNVPIAGTQPTTEFSQSVLKRGGTRVAFFGDQGLNENSKAVLRLVKNEGTDLVMHLGDFDYANSPQKWVNQIHQYLGTSTPYIAVMGNHEKGAWEGYRAKVSELLANSKDVTCTGEPGIESTCKYKDISFILTTPNLTKMDHAGYIKQQLAQSTTTWNICAWHENQHTMQVGAKADESGWDVYENCKAGGGIIATGHEHSYERTYLLSSFKNQTVATTSNVLQLEKGKSFAFVAGLGGESIRNQESNGPWWASIYTTNQHAASGALFCTFGTNGEKDRAECYFKDIKGRIADQFIIKAVSSSAKDVASSTAKITK